jgi:hypothetical protein
MCFDQLIILFGVCIELILLGFMSLILAVIQEPISKICISAKAAETMLPCRKQETSQAIQVVVRSLKSIDTLLWQPRRRLEDDEEGTTTTDDAGADSCTAEVCFLVKLN